MKLKIATIALESSGRHWMDSILRQHPDLELVAAMSEPSEWHPNRHYPEVPEGIDRLVVCVRDQNCSQASVTAMGYNTGYKPQEFAHEDNVRVGTQWIRRHSIRTVFFDYEAAILYRADYLDWFFIQLGLQPVPVEVEYRDENRKYLK